MDLVNFIRGNRQRIASQWLSASQELFPEAQAAERLAEGDRALHLLDAVVRDLAAPDGADSREVAAALAEAVREAASFDPVLLTAELHALKSSVLALWMAQPPRSEVAACREMLRFDRAVDHAVAETAACCKAEAERARNAFLAILGHDLRGPLSAIAMAGHYLEATGLLGEKQLGAVGSINRGAAIMKVAIRDLIEYARSRLSGGMPITPEQVDLAGVCRSAIAEVRTAYPDCEFLFDGEGEFIAPADKGRLQQLVLNLLHNAVQHGTRRLPVHLGLRREADAVVLSVTNMGPVIPARRLAGLFDPFSRVALKDADNDSGAVPSHLGLGLFIAREIAAAHKGSIEVASSDADGTTFTVRLPG